MYLLDNDAFNLDIAGDENVAGHIRQNAGRIWLSSVAAEELLIGRMSGINRARSAHNSLSLPLAHQSFVKALEDIRRFPVLVYSDEADAVFQAFSPALLRLGSQDCRIAAQAIAHDLTVITRNLRHFEAIGVPCADWSAHSTSR